MAKFLYRLLACCLALWNGAALAQPTLDAAAEREPPSGTRSIYFADCQSGAAATCVAGDNANPGTRDAPKRDLTGIQLNSLGSTQLLFARGGVWEMTMLRIENVHVSARAPLVFDAWGSGPAPTLRFARDNGFLFGRYQSTVNDGGYVIRNLKLDGLGTGQWGIYLGDHVRDVVIENLEITGFAIGIHAQSVSAPGVSGLLVRKNHVHRNRQHGILSKADNAVYEDNLIERNNASASNRNHGIYLSGGDGIVVRRNRLVRNSISESGRCEGGNFTLHGQTTGLTIEDNVIEQDAAGGGCYGFSITPGYFQAEWFRNAIVRGNRVVNVGNCAICVGAAPGIVIENNLSINHHANYHVGVSIPTGTNGEVAAGDAADESAVVRNNITCQATPHQGSASVLVNVPRAVVSGNEHRTGAAARSGPCVLK